jgi:LysM repeat protein
MATPMRHPRQRFAASALLLVLLLSLAAVNVTSAQECTWTHLVRPGDTLTSIARNYGVSVSDIVKLNSQITSPDLIKWGTTICVSNTASPPGLLPGSYTVKPGDTLISIALRFGASLVDLARANGIGNPNHILAGDTLTVPTEEPAPDAVVTPEPTPEATPETTPEAAG